MLYLVYSLQASMFYFIFFNSHAKANLGGIIPEQVFETLERKKWGAAMMTFFIGNLLSGNISSTGAFEIFLNGKLISSKIHQSMLPKFPELVKLIKKAGILLE
mmetsp:Transcript_2603/g.2668  ORF Transcript_2603/g.2668 Transcript_2603/m.2668 type:complete len:103 (-) Transcript_2603:104-412(-)